MRSNLIRRSVPYQGYDRSIRRVHRLADFGLSDTIRQGLIQTMDNTIDVLRRSAASLKTRISMESSAEKLSALLGPLAWLTVNATTSSGDAKAAALSAMNTLNNIITRLATTSRDEVLAGTLPTEKWIASAEEVANGITAQAKIYNDEAIISVVTRQIEQAIKDFRALGANAGNFLDDILRFVTANKWWFVAGGGVLGLLLIAPNLLALKRTFSWFDPEQRDLE